ncbi:MAG: nitroreductase family protein, partial [Anaerolineae bacterium]|nr:nitroreductase family protein [Anaerolineae bacterium]
MRRSENMDFTTLVENRYSVRGYKRNRVGQKKLQRVLEAMRLAPTATNNQAFQFIVIHTEGREEELRRIYDTNWFVRAPLVVAACGIPAENWVRADGKNYNDVDVAIA